MVDWGSGSGWYSRIYENVKSNPRLLGLITCGLVVLLAPHGYASTHHTISLGNFKDDHLFDNDYDVYHNIYSRVTVLFVCAVVSFNAVKCQHDEQPSNTTRHLSSLGSVVVAIMLPFVLSMGVYVVRLTECTYSEKTGIGLWAVVPLVFIAI